MSNHHWKPSQHIRKLPPWTVLSFTIVGLGALLLLMDFPPKHTAPAKWRTSSAHVIGTRITVVGLLDADQAHPAEIKYHAEAHVSYLADGKRYIEWLPATGTTTSDRDWLIYLLSRKKDDLADVKWNPSDPTQGSATLHLY